MSWLEEAQDPQTQQERLRELSKLHHPHIIAAVAQNPNIPSDVLFALVSRFPKQILENPALGLLLLENPDFFSRLSVEVICIWARLESVSLEILQWASLHRAAQVRRAVAQNRKLTQPLLERLSRDPDSLVVCFVARHPTTPPALLGKLSSHTSSAVLRAVASNKNTPRPVLERLAGSYQRKIRQEAYRQLRGEHTPQDDLSYLSVSHHEQVRRSAALNPKTPLEALASLSEDESEEVRTAVAQNESLQEHLFFLLARDPSDKVRANLARNPRIPTAVLWQLSEGSLPIRLASASNPRAPAKMLAQLSNERAQLVRVAVAKNPNTQEETLLQMLSTREEPVRVAIAQNPSATPEILRRLAKDHTRQVICAVAAHPNTPTECLLGLAQRAMRRTEEATQLAKGFLQNPKTWPALLSHLAYHPALTLLVASHPNTSPETLSLLSSRSDRKIRSAVAAHPNIKEEVFWLLLSDKSKLVRLAALSHARCPQERLSLLQKAGISPSFSRQEPEAALSPEELLLLSSGGVRARRVAASHLPQGADALFILAQDLASSVRAIVASRPEVKDPALCRALLQNPKKKVARALAKNANTPHEILALLAKSEERKVRKAVAKNPNTRREVLEALAFDTWPTVRRAVTKHPLVPYAILWNLGGDARGRVRSCSYWKLEDRYRCKDFF